MFQIRDEHMRGFQDVAMDTFVERGVRHVRKNLAPQCEGLTDDELRTRIRKQSERSRQYGLTTERQMMRFVDANFLAGENYLTERAGQWARDILERRDSAEDGSSELLDEAVARA